MVTFGGVFNPVAPHPGRQQAHNRNQTIKTQNTGGGTIATPAPLALLATALLLSACGGDSEGPAAHAADPAGRYEASETALRIAADELIDIVEDIVAQAPDKFAIATSVSEVRSHF